MDQSIERFCASHGVNTVNVMEKLEFVNKQWGMFCAWLREQHPVLVEKEVLKQKFYANSPFDLASENDNLYRNAVDESIDK